MRKLLRSDYLWIAGAALSLQFLAGCTTGGWSMSRAPVSKNAVPRSAVSRDVAGTQTASSSAPQTAAPQQVVVVQGAVGYWPGCDDFVANLAVRGAPATTIRGFEVKRTADKIAATRQSGKQTGPIVLVGYGRGANDALRLARRLQESDIVVNKVVLLETAANDSVPANVESCLNVYQSSSTEDWLPALRGLPVTVESANTQLVNYNLRFHDEGVARADLNHFTVCKNYSVLSMVTDHVTAALQQDGSQNGLPGVRPGPMTGEPASQVATRLESTQPVVDERFLPFE